MLSGNALKLLALVFMTLDHAGLMLFPTVRWLRIAGRLAMPIFAYMLAEGMRHTRSMRGYGTRMVTQGLICQLLFALAGSDWRFNIFFTFSLSILMVAAIRKAQQKKNLFCWALVLLSVAGSFALCERELTANSSVEGRIGFFVKMFTFGLLPHTQTGKFLGQVQPPVKEAKVCLTIRSSSEWKVMMAMRPPLFKRDTADLIAGAITSSSALTSMRNA